MLSFLILSITTTFAQQKQELPPVLGKFSRSVTFYYQAPNPEIGPKLLEELLKEENIHHPFFAKRPDVLNIIGAQLGDIARGDPNIVRKYESLYGGAPAGGRSVILRGLENCGDAQSLAAVKQWITECKDDELLKKLERLQNVLSDEKHKHIRDRDPQTPHELDLLWANFFITGEYQPVERILDVLDRPDAGQNVVMKRAARWSLASNLQQHKKLVELLEKHLDKRSAQSKQQIKQFLEKVKNPKP